MKFLIKFITILYLFLIPVANASSGCERVLSEGQRPFIYHATLPENLRFLAQYGLYNRIGRGTFFDEALPYMLLDPRVDHDEVFIAIPSSPRWVRPSRGSGSEGLGYTISEENIVEESQIPDIDIWTTWAPQKPFKLLHLLRQVSGSSDHIGHIPPEAIDWEESVRITAFAIQENSTNPAVRNDSRHPGNPLKPLRHLSMEEALEWAHRLFIAYTPDPLR